MTLEEAIKHCEEKAQGCDACSQEYRELAEWLKELQENKRAAKEFGIRLEDHRDYEWLVNQVEKIKEYRGIE